MFLFPRRAAGLAALAASIVALAGCPESSGDRSSGESPATAGPSVTPDVVYGQRSGLALTMDLYRPPVPNGAVVLFINSGGFVSGKMRGYDTLSWNRYRVLEPDELHLTGDPTPIPLFEQFAFAGLLGAGFSVCDVRHGSSPPFTLPEITADVRRAVRFVHGHAADLGVDPDRIGVWGVSSGGYLALYAAMAGDDGSAGAENAGPTETGDAGERPESPVRSAAVFYPAGFDLAADAERFPEVAASLPALQADPAVLDSLSLKHYLSPDAPPSLIVYGDADFPFIVESSESVYVGLTRLGVECRRVVMPGSGHEFRGPDGYRPEHGRSAQAEMVDWFRKTLAAR